MLFVLWRREAIKGELRPVRPICLLRPVPLRSPEPLFAMSSEQHDSRTPVGAQFAPTQWTVVLTARGDNTVARDALEKLCRAYWPPIYAFVRRQGHSPHD